MPSGTAVTQLDEGRFAALRQVVRASGFVRVAPGQYALPL